jgi:hypothetical protein
VNRIWRHISIDTYPKHISADKYPRSIKLIDLGVVLSALINIQDLST